MCWKILIPGGGPRSIIKKFHDEMDHFGIKEPWLILRKYIFWKSVKKGLQVCAESKPDLRKIKKTDYYITSQYSLQLISVNIIGRLPRSQTWEYILSLVDTYLKFVMIYPLRKANTSEIIRRIDELSKRYGPPEKNTNGKRFLFYI